MEVLLRRRSSEACRAIATGETSLERPRGCMSKRKGMEGGDVRESELIRRAVHANKVDTGLLVKIGIDKVVDESTQTTQPLFVNQRLLFAQIKSKI